MTKFDLKSPSEAEFDLQKIILDEITFGNTKFSISCCDDSAFVADEWLNLGQIRIPLNSNHISENSNDQMELIHGYLQKGVYEWVTPETSKVRKKLDEVLGNENKESSNSSLLTDIANVGYRTCLIRPLFDAMALMEMPYKKDTTIVVDTSSVIQGGFDFVCEFLQPEVSVMIPAMVDTELRISSNNYFSKRRRDKKSIKDRHDELSGHLNSQGGQRALDRWEIYREVELERPLIQGVHQLNNANADPQILEEARRYQAQSSPNHKVRLLTADQGLAREAYRKGIFPLYFKATKADSFFGKKLTGCMFHPFSGKPQRISLVYVLWELAISFGSVKFEGVNRGNNIEIKSIGKGLEWTTTKTHDDVLWCKTNIQVNTAKKSQVSLNNDQSTSSETQTEELSNSISVEALGSKKKVTFYGFNVAKLIRLICMLDDKQELTLNEVLNILGTTTPRGADEYRSLLLSGRLIILENGLWKPTKILSRLSIAIRNNEKDLINQYLLNIPSYKEFITELNKLETEKILEIKPYGSRIRGYLILGEITMNCIEIRGQGIYSTKTIPNLNDFAEIAKEHYRELATGEGLVPVGAWLENLIRKNGIHPVVAKDKLNQAAKEGLINRTTEGSTTQFRKGNQYFHILHVEERIPQINRIHYYRGDFLIPEKASVTIRISE